MCLQFARYGVNSQISVVAYDPVQSLLAVGTNESPFGPGAVYIYGQKRVCVTFNTPRRSSIRAIQFCADKVIVLDSKNDVSIFSLDSKHLVANYAPPGHVTTMLSDPSLDYCFTGLQNGASGDDDAAEEKEADQLTRRRYRRRCGLRFGPRNPHTLQNPQSVARAKPQSASPPGRVDAVPST